MCQWWLAKVALQSRDLKLETEQMKRGSEETKMNNKKIIHDINHNNDNNDEREVV